MPSISVVIPSFNHPAYLGAAVQSVLTQSLSDLELIVVDDGSTDNSLEILGHISDPRLRVIAQENQGAHAALNRGLALASADYLAILNSDDLYHPRRLKTLVQALVDDPDLGLAGSYIEIIDQQGQTLGVKHGYRDVEPWPLDKPERSFRAGDNLHAALLTENYLATTSNYVFRRSWYERAGPFRPLRYAHDWDFGLRLAAMSRLHLHAEPLLKYRVHPHNTIRENQAAMIFEICWCLAMHLPRQMRSPALTAQPLDQQIDQLLHSIHTFGMEQVLVVLLLQNLPEHEETAWQLLQTENPARRHYLAFIEARLASSSTPGTENALPPDGLSRLVNKLKAGLRLE